MLGLWDELVAGTPGDHAPVGVCLITLTQSTEPPDT